MREHSISSLLDELSNQSLRADFDASIITVVLFGPLDLPVK